MTENGKKWVVCKTILFEKQGVFLNHKYLVDWDSYFENVYVMKNYIPKKYFELYTDLDLKFDEYLAAPKHYDNSKGSLYKTANERGWNSYLFEVVKRVERAEKKGEFISDIKKSIHVLELYLKEQGEKFKGEIEPLNK